MKKIFLFLGIMTMMFASCSTDEQAIDSSSGKSVPGRTVTLNASIPNSGSGTRAKHSVRGGGLVTDWSSDDCIDVLVNANARLSMTKGTANNFTTTTQDPTVAEGFNTGKTIYGVNNKSDDNITTDLNGTRLKATVDFTGQDGTVDNLNKYDLMYGQGDPTGKITFNHKICIMRLDICSGLLKTDGITGITGLKLKYVPSSGTPLFATGEEYNFGATCDSTVTSADSIYLNNTNITFANDTASVYIAVPDRQSLNGKLYIHIKGSDGTLSKTYDLTNPISLSNKSFAMSTIQSKVISNLSRTTVNVGNYLFSDGTWGNLADSFGSTPIAVIFSKTTTTTDQGHGWTHGYALAFKNALKKCKWGTSGSNPTGTRVSLSNALKDDNGYTYTQKINKTTYPAAYAAATTYNLTVPAPATTSGWYLPSAGQWSDVVVNLGNYNTKKTGASCSASINTYLTPLADGTYDTFSYGDTSSYWSSSEVIYITPSSNMVCTLFFSDNASILYGDRSSSASYIARSVLAF